MEKFKKNEFTLVGTLANADIKLGNRTNDGAGYVSVKAIVTNNINGRNNEFEVEFYAYEMTAKKEVSKLYTNYVEMNKLVGKKVEINGSLKENRYWSNNQGQIISTTTLSGKFIKGALETTPEVATFVIGGFVAKELVEKKNKNNEIYRYDLTIAQTDYTETSLNMFTLHVNPDETAIVNGVRNYQAGQTIKLDGSLSFTVEEKVVEDTNTAFGKPLPKVYKNKSKNFFIESGSNPIKDESSYDSEAIRNLIDAYKAKDVELAAGAKKENAPVVKEAPVKTRQTSLV